MKESIKQLNDDFKIIILKTLLDELWEGSNEIVCWNLACFNNKNYVNEEENNRILNDETSVALRLMRGKNKGLCELKKIEFDKRGHCINCDAQY